MNILPEICVQLHTNVYKHTQSVRLNTSLSHQEKTTGSLPNEGGNPAGLLEWVLPQPKENNSTNNTSKNRVRNQYKKGTWPLTIGFPHDPTRPHFKRQETVIGIHMISLWRCYKTIKWFLCQDQLNTEIFVIPTNTLFSSHPSLLKNILFRKILQTSRSRFFLQYKQEWKFRPRFGLLVLGFFFLSPL